MRSRLLAAALTATALLVAGTAGAQAAPPDSSTTTTSQAPMLAVPLADPTTTTTTLAPTTSSTSTTLPGDDAVEATTIPPSPVNGPGAADAPATRTGNTVQVGDTTPPPPLEEALPPNSGEGRRVVYSNSQMRVWAVEENGTVVKTHRVSGLSGMPSPGTYSVWSRSLYTFSANNPNIRWMYMVRFAWTPRGGNIGFHEIPTDCSGGSCHKMQTEAQLGQSLSGGCVRQSTPDAIWMWDWAQLGTKVVVLA